MSTAYAKIFESLFDGSLRGMSDPILVFVNILTHARNGIADIHFKKISDETGVPIDRVKSACSLLEQPDPDSRTPDEEGRRIVRLDDHRDWGWRVVNARKYRFLGGQDDRTKELTRIRVEEYRKRKGEKAALRNVTETLPSGSGSVPGSVPEGGAGGTPVEFPPGFPPSVDDAVSHAAFVGCDPVFATTVWNLAAGRGGRDSRDVPVRRWRNYLQTQWTYEQERRNKEKINGTNGHSRAPFINELKAQMDAKQRQIDSHIANPQSITYRKNCTDLEKASLRQLRKDIVELNNRIANGGKSA
ncbi:hypothetical protein KGP36_02670 [Patescibacteria group bacterium]|nr:hypothetical protein [Patescibacteria group bacterium]